LRSLCRERERRWEREDSGERTVVRESYRERNWIPPRELWGERGEKTVYTVEREKVKIS
jgi:hypothetical protein